MVRLVGVRCWRMRRDDGPMAINPMIYAEMSVRFDTNRGRRSGAAARIISSERRCPGRRPFWRQGVRAVPAPRWQQRTIAAAGFLHRRPRGRRRHDAADPRRAPISRLLSQTEDHRALRAATESRVPMTGVPALQPLNADVRPLPEDERRRSVPRRSRRRAP